MDTGQTVSARTHLPSGKVTSWLKVNWGYLFVVVLLVVFPFLFSLISSTPVTSGAPLFWQGQLIIVFIMAVYAMSYDLLMGYVGILSFGHAAFFGGGAYAMALFLNQAYPSITSRYIVTLPGGADITGIVVLILAFLLVILVSASLGLLFSAVSARIKGVYFAMITLAMGQALYILTKATDFVRWTGADEGLHGVPIPAWLNPTDHRLRFYFLALLFMVVMYMFIRRVVDSPTGKIFVAMRENEDRARAIGYNPAVYRTLAIVISAISAGLAGGLFALWSRGVTPSLASTATTINALIMTILGGAGTLIGPMLGAGIMQVFSQFLYQWFGARWPLVFGAIYIALVIFLPYGIVGTWNARKLRLKEGWKRWIGLVKKT